GGGTRRVAGRIRGGGRARTGGLPARQGPGPRALDEPRVAAGLFTPTALAEDPDRAERAGAFALAVDGIALVGPAAPPAARGPLIARSIGDVAVVRFAEAARPSPGDGWRITVMASLTEADPLRPTDPIHMQVTLH